MMALTIRKIKSLANKGHCLTQGSTTIALFLIFIQICWSNKCNFVKLPNSLHAGVDGLILIIYPAIA